MVNGMNTVHVWLYFLAAKEICKTPHNVFPCMSLMLNTSELLFIKEKYYSGSCQVTQLFYQMRNNHKRWPINS